MTWQIFPNVTFTNGSKNIAVNDSTATTGILAGYAVNKDNKSYEIESITSSAIILVDAWDEATTANVKIKIQPTSEPIKEYIQETLGEVKGLVADYLARLQLEESIISSTGTVPFTDSAGVIHDIPGWGNLEASMLAKMQEFGLGSDDIADFSGDCDSLNKSGIFLASGSSTGRPSQVGGAACFIFVGSNAAVNTFQLAFRQGKSEMYFRSSAAGVFEAEWNEVFTTASVEYGNNANGEYWKYPDGKLICTQAIGSSSIAHGCSVSYSSLGLSGYISDSAINWTYPHAFISGPSTFVDCNRSDRAVIAINDKGSNTTTALNGTKILANAALGAGYHPRVGFAAIGRWK